MPRPRRPGAPEPKRRSRKGCWPCKARKIKCGEEKPACLNCCRQNEPCDYSFRLNWGGRTRRRPSVSSPGSQCSSVSFTFPLSPPDMSQPQPANTTRQFESGSMEVNAAQDEPAEMLFWDIRLAGEMTLGRTYPSRLHDIQDSPTVPDQSLKPPNRTTDRAAVEMDLSRGQDMTTWPNSSTGDTGPLPRNRNPDGLVATPFVPQYLPDSENNTNIPSLLEFNFPSGPISQPVSFVRPAIEASEYAFKQASLPGYENCSAAPVDMGSTGVADCTTASPSDSHGALSPYSLDTSLFASGTPQDFEETSDSSLGRLMDGSPGVSLNRLKATRSSSIYAHSGRHALGDHRSLTNSEKWQAYLTTVTDHYGVDCGRPDTDLGNNDDHSAIDVSDALDTVQSQTGSNASSPGIISTRIDRELCDRKYNYYGSPVPINIPRYLSPLPASLLNVPINLMYFHHFLNHTAKVLVPHDCGDNPFSSVLPAMAINDSNLLNLMLAYSASHRARFLGHPEPANRIAHWVSNVFPSLRVALDEQEKITDSHLATAIMLLSLKIVSPSTFEVPIPWQSHLKLARDLFLARQAQIAYPGNRVGAFLTRWLGYLDIMGSLSCRHHQPPLLAYYSVLNTCTAIENWDEFAVDCFTGFTPRTGLFLMQLGGLVHHCDNERFDETGAFLPEWRPSPEIVHEAEALISDWETLDTHAHAFEKHYQDSESFDMIAVDRAFRYAGLLHLHRRVLGNSSSSDAVSEALDGLMQSVAAIRSGSAVEAGVLFPIFTAGCETQDSERRTEIKERLEVLEGTGMKQIHNARTLMQRCWDTKLPWIVFAQGEFLG
ncbi:fungal-specific transcription factor domain-containing protein [Aspergillus tetrazonus]